MLWQQLQEQTVDLGWEFYGPVLVIVVLIGLAVPVWVALGIGAVLMLLVTDVLPLGLLGESLFDGIDHFALIAVPLFILTGDVLVRTGLSNKLLDVADATTGGFRAGLGTATVLGCGFFACISGSDAAGAAAVGRMTIHKLVDKGYPRPYACALVASGACTGILIPPSIAYIIVGLILGISASTLFLAAAIPGVRWRKAVWDGRYALLVPIIILGGIYSGVFTPTEAAAVAVGTTITIGLLQRTLTLADFPKMLISSAKVNGVILPIIAMSLPLAQTLAALNVPQGFVYSVTSLTEDPMMIKLMMIGILIIAGCVMETTPNIVVLSPILLPLAQEIGMNEIQFCIMMITSLGVGFITPPLGLNLFVISGITGESVLKIAARAVPYVIGMLVVVLLIAYVPVISTVFLPDIY
jgi:TRAP-type C4-dicarboxylate transport system permease large subunit